MSNSAFFRPILEVAKPAGIAINQDFGLSGHFCKVGHTVIYRCGGGGAIMANKDNKV